MCSKIGYIKRAKSHHDDDDDDVISQINVDLTTK
jgi:hypothetical protein